MWQCYAAAGQIKSISVERVSEHQEETEQGPRALRPIPGLLGEQSIQTYWVQVLRHRAQVNT